MIQNHQDPKGENDSSIHPDIEWRGPKEIHSEIDFEGREAEG
jgi:hypothetical protein